MNQMSPKLGHLMQNKLYLTLLSPFLGHLMHNNRHSLLVQPHFVGAGEDGAERAAVVGGYLG